MKSGAAKASTSGARASSPAVFGVSPNTFSIKHRPRSFLNRSKTLTEACQKTGFQIRSDRASQERPWEAGTGGVAGKGNAPAAPVHRPASLPGRVQKRQPQAAAVEATQPGRRPDANAGGEKGLPNRGKRTKLWVDPFFKGDPAKVALAARLRQETRLTIGQIAQRQQMGSRNTLNNHLHQWRKTNEATVSLGKSTV